MTQFFALDPKTPIRTNDTDQTTGNYFGIMLTALATQGLDPRADALLANPFVGGFDPTGSDLTSLRNAVHKYITEWATGGVWIESAYYDVETLQLVVQGVEAMRTATGVDHFPEFAGFDEQVVRCADDAAVADLLAAPKWGDIEDARDAELASLPGARHVHRHPAGARRCGPIATQFVNDLRAAAKADEDPVYGSLLLLLQSRAPAADWRTLPLSHYAAARASCSRTTAGARRQPVVHAPASAGDERRSREHQFGDFRCGARAAGW